MTLVLHWTSPGPSEYAPSGPHLDLLTLVTTWASSGHVSTAWPEGWPHLDLVSGVATCTSPIPGEFVAHLDLIAVDSFLASPGTGDSDPNWASPRYGDSGPHLWTIMTWILCSTPKPHLDMMTLNLLWASP